jgi:hypothetical protein
MRTATVLLAADDGVSAGYLGLLVVLLLCVATALLIRNMNARLRRLPKSFDDQVSRPEDAPDESASGPTAGA